MISEITPCDMCFEGNEIDPGTGNIVPCLFCKGEGFVTPGVICCCGRTCNTTSPEGIDYCGDKACLTDREREARIQDWGHGY